MASSTRVTLTTLVGRWELEAHGDGALTVLDFVPMTRAEAAASIAEDAADDLKKVGEIRDYLEDRKAQQSEVPIAGRSLMAKAFDWAKAEASLLTQGPLPDDAYAARVAACRACDQFDPREAPQVGWCKACGCGQNARAEMTIKGRMPAANCPLDKWPAYTA